MAFADPQSVTISGVNGGAALSLPRTSSGPSSGEFTSADGLIKMTISHRYSKRYGRMLKLTQSKLSADPLNPAVNSNKIQSCWMAVDVPPVGFTITESKAIVDALVAYLSASTGAKVTQLLGGES
jgi:hypothetical protein